MVTYRDVSPTPVIEKAAEELQKNDKIQAPEWAIFVKTGIHKVNQPVDENWWYVRCAAILRSVAELGPIGTNKLRIKYGGKQRRGHKKSRFQLGSGSIARKSLQQLQAAGLIKEGLVGTRKGRVITGEGQRVLDKAAGAVVEEQNGNK